MQSTHASPPRWNPPWRGEGPYLTKSFHPSASTRRARRRDSAMFDQNKRMFFMLMSRTWFKAEEFRLEQPPYLWYLFVTCRFWFGADLYPISIYIIFSLAVNTSYSFLSSLWRPEFLSLEVMKEMKELGRSTQINIHNTRS